MKELTHTELMQKIEALGEIAEEQRNSIVCALVGHSSIVRMCFGYVNCGRCGDQIGDRLAGAFSLENKVVVGHDCPTCRKNFQQMTWRDTLYAKDPFQKEEAA